MSKGKVLVVMSELALPSPAIIEPMKASGSGSAESSTNEAVQR
jgi:hypothetical protein